MGTLHPSQTLQWQPPACPPHSLASLSCSACHALKSGQEEHSRTAGQGPDPRLLSQSIVATLSAAAEPPRVPQQPQASPPLCHQNVACRWQVQEAVRVREGGASACPHRTQGQAGSLPEHWPPISSCHAKRGKMHNHLNPGLPRQSG